MKNLTTALFLLTISLPPVRADYVLKFRVDTAGQGSQPSEIIVKVTKTKARIDAPACSFFFDSTDYVTILDHSSETCKRMNGQTAKVMFDGLVHLVEPAGGEATEFKPTGKTEVINGYEAQEYSGSIAGIIHLRLFLVKDFHLLPEAFMKDADPIGPVWDAFRNLIAPMGMVPDAPIRVAVESLWGSGVITFESSQEADLSDRDVDAPPDCKPAQSAFPFF
jgi:hypothetical protein